MHQYFILVSIHSYVRRHMNPAVHRRSSQQQCKPLLHMTNKLSDYTKQVGREYITKSFTCMKHNIDCLTLIVISDTVLTE